MGELVRRMGEQSGGGGGAGEEGGEEGRKGGGPTALERAYLQRE